MLSEVFINSISIFQRLLLLPHCDKNHAIFEVSRGYLGDDVDAVNISLLHASILHFKTYTANASSQSRMNSQGTTSGETCPAWKAIGIKSPRNPEYYRLSYHPVILETFHYLFHPATVYVRSLLASYKYEKTQIYMRLKNIFNLEPGGGALMDMMYTLLITRCMLLGPGPGSGRLKEIVSEWQSYRCVDGGGDGGYGSGGKYEFRSKPSHNRLPKDYLELSSKFWKQPMFVADCKDATITHSKYDPFYTCIL